MNRLCFSATILLCTVFSAGAVFHILVLLGYVPTTIVWGGRFSNTSDIYQLEVVSLVLNVLLLLFTLSNMGIWLKPLPHILNKVLLGVFCLLFLLNTVGNTMAKTNIEKYIFTPITAISFFCFGLLFFRKTVSV